MENTGLNKVDLIFESVEAKEVLEKAFKMSSPDIIQNILDSGLKGRGGAGFPTGLVPGSSPPQGRWWWQGQSLFT